mgnify:CR=1 FL=1
MLKNTFTRTFALFAIIFIAFVSVTPINVSAAWAKDSKGNYYYKDEAGKYLTGFQTIGGKTYFFGKDGKMYTDKWITTTSGSKYYFKKDGTMATGKIKLNGKVYEFDSNGKLIVLSKLWKPFEGLEWGMNEKEVIKALELEKDEYSLSDNVLMVIKPFYCNQYFFEEDSGLIGFVHITLNNSFETYKELLVSDGFELLSKEDNNTLVYGKDDKLFAMIIYEPKEVIEDSTYKVTTYAIFNMDETS